MAPATPLPSWSDVKAANDLVIPELSAAYRRAASEFTASGLAVMDWSLAKSSLGGEKANHLLFLPAGILAFGKNTSVLLDIFDVTTKVPWLHWTLMRAIRGFRCLLLRRLEWEGNQRVDDVRSCAVFGETGIGWTSPLGGLFPSTPGRRGAADYARLNAERFASLPTPDKKVLSQAALSNQITRMYLLAELVAYLKADAATEIEAIPHSATITAGGKRLAYLLTHPLVA